MTTSPIDLTEEDGKCRNSKWSKSTMRSDCASVYLKSGIPKRQKTEILCIHYRRRYSVVICKLDQRLENTVLVCLVVWYTLDYSDIEDRGWMEVELSKAKSIILLWPLQASQVSDGEPFYWFIMYIISIYFFSWTFTSSKRKWDTFENYKQICERKIKMIHIHKRQTCCNTYALLF